MKLFTVGPVACRPEVLREMSTQMFSHRSAEYVELHNDTVRRLQKFLETKNQIFLLPSSSTGMMEASIRNCVRKKVLCCVNGEFGRRFSQVAKANGKVVVDLEIPLGEPITPEALDEALRKNPDVEAVTIVYSETSTGLLNPLRELAKVAAEHGKMVLVDAVSAMGGVELKIDEWGIDVCFAGSQKCFGVPPGLTVGVVSQRALEASEKMENKGWYFDFKIYEKYNQRGNTPTTPPIPQIAALRKELEIIEEEGGKRARLALYRKRFERIVQGVKEMGLSLFPRAGYESPTVACVNAPPGMTGHEVYERMRERGFEIARGYRQLGERTFRIGNMGYITFDEIDEMLMALAEVVTQSKRPPAQ